MKKANAPDSSQKWLDTLTESDLVQIGNDLVEAWKSSTDLNPPPGDRARRETPRAKNSTQRGNIAVFSFPRHSRERQT